MLRSIIYGLNIFNYLETFLLLLSFRTPAAFLRTQIVSQTAFVVS